MLNSICCVKLRVNKEVGKRKNLNDYLDNCSLLVKTVSYQCAPRSVDFIYICKRFQ